jgi:uncharacterized repeat protein (TIGR02543 family)
MKKKFLLYIYILFYISIPLFSSGITEGSTYVKTILERDDNVSNYFKEVINPHTLKNGPLQLTSIPLLSEVFILNEYPDLNNKRVTTSEIVDIISPLVKVLGKKEENSGIFLFYLRYNEQERTALIDTSSFTIDPNFFNYLFLDNNAGDFLRVSDYSVASPVQVSISNPIYEFWVIFGKDQKERDAFFNNSKEIYLTVTDFGFEGKKLPFNLPLAEIFEDMPDETKEILNSLRNNIKVSFYDSDISSLKHQKSNSLIEEPQIPIKKGFNFKGWYKDFLYKEKWDFTNDRIFSDINIYAKWEPKSYTISFITDENVSLTSNSKEVKYGSTYGFLPRINDSEYFINDWYTEPNNNGTKIKESSQLNINQDHTLYADCEKYINVNFETDANLELDFSNKKVKYNSSYGKLPTINNSEYFIKDWYIESNNKGLKITENSKVEINKDHFLYADYTKGKNVEGIYYNLIDMLFLYNKDEGVTKTSMPFLGVGYLYGKKYEKPNITIGYGFGLNLSVVTSPNMETIDSEHNYLDLSLFFPIISFNPGIFNLAVITDLSLDNLYWSSRLNLKVNLAFASISLGVGYFSEFNQVLPYVGFGLLNGLCI